MVSEPPTSGPHDAAGQPSQNPANQMPPTLSSSSLPPNFSPTANNYPPPHAAAYPPHTNPILAGQHPLSSHMYDSYEEEEEIPIPNSLKFMLDALKILAQTPLTIDNHLIWTSQVEQIFNANGYQKHLNPTMPKPPPYITLPNGSIAHNPTFKRFNLINRNLLAALVSTISPTLQPFVLGRETVADLWISLKMRLQSTTKSRIIQLKEELHSLQMKGTTMTQYLTSVKAILDQLEASGSHVDDEDIMIYIMNGLPPLYNSIKAALRIKDTPTNLHSFYSILLSEEQNLNRQIKAEENIHTAALSTFKGRPPNARTGNRSKERNPNRPPSTPKPVDGQGGKTGNTQCQICKKLGHCASTCWFRYTPKETGETSKTAYITDGSSPTVGHNSAPQGEWFLDSGASANLTNQFNHLHLPQPYRGQDTITIGDGSQLPITHTGQHTLNTPTSKFHLSNLLFVPTLKHKLISVYHFTKSNNCSITFDSDGFFIQDKKTHQVLHRGRTYNGLYPLTTTVIANSAISTTATTWHQRLGHPHPAILRQLSKNLVSMSFPSVLPTCISCGTCKSHKVSFMESCTRSSFPFELVHSDVWGPSPVVSIQNFKYYVLFVDDFTKFSWIFPMRHKSEVFTYFKTFHLMIQNQFQTNIKTFRSDGGGEYTSHIFTDYILQNGILHQFSCPHTPEQNGVAERKHRHIMETARTLLHQAHLPQKFWLEAASTAVSLINILPTPTLNMDTPYHKLHLQHPTYTNLRTFGCLCFPWTAHPPHSKLDPKSSPCIFLGYSSQHKGYRCYNPKTHSLIISRHVRFHEHDFPSSTSTNNLPTPPLPTSTYIPPLLLQPIQPNPSHDHTEPYISPPTPRDPSPLALAEPPQPPNRFQHTYHRRPKQTPLQSIQTEPNLPLSKPTEPSHPMLTRSKTNLNPPTTITNLNHSLTEPTSYHQAQQNPHWTKAMQEEINALNNQHTWILVPKPINHTILGSKWTYKTKTNPDGTISRYKARLVAQGFRQTYGLDYTDTFSPVAKVATIRLFFLVALQQDWPIQQIDISNAFLHGTLQEKVYMKQPRGFEDPSRPNHVCLLQKSIYGLKQSSRQWNAALTAHFQEQGFTSSTADPSLYLYKRDGIQTYILIYVDDLLLTGNSPTHLRSVQEALGRTFQTRFLGAPQMFLGIHIQHTVAGYLLHQSSYAEHIIHSAGLDSCTPVSTPLPSKEPDVTHTSPLFSNPKLYRSLTGSLQYLTLTRPDITHAVNRISQHMQAPQEHHFSLITRLLRYIKGTVTFGLPIHRGPSHLRAYTDSDWAGDPTDRTSTTGFCIFLGPNLITWKTQKQRTVARSSSEAEYRALSSTITETIWLSRLLEEFCIPSTPPTIIYCDNTSAIAIARNPILKARTKHVEIDHHFIREHLLSGAISLEHIPTKDQVADLFTKRLPRHHFKHLCTKLTIQPRDA